MVFNLRNWTFLLSLFMLLSCGGKDEIPPTVSLSLPNGPILASANDNISIIADFTDDKKLASFQITLVNENTLAVVKSYSEELNGIDAKADLSFTLGNKFTESGNYLLKLFVFDAGGNSDFDEIQVSLIGLPDQYDGLFVIGENAQEEANLFSVDISNQNTDFGKIGDQVSAFKADLKSGKLFYATKVSARLQARSYENPSLLIFDQSVPNGTNQTAFTGLEVIGQELVASLGIPPFGRVYDLNGNSLKTLNGLEYPAPALCITNDFPKKEAFFAQVETPGTIKRVDKLHYDISIHLNSSNLSWVPEVLVPTNNGGVLAGGSENGSGKLIAFGPSGSILYSHTLNRPVRTLECGGSSQTTFIITEDGIFSTQSWGASISSLLKAGDYYSLHYDPVQNVFYAGGNGFIDKIAPNGSWLAQILGPFEKVKFLQGRYSK